jgi:hypothetical protein
MEVVDRTTCAVAASSTRAGHRRVRTTSRSKATRSCRSEPSGAGPLPTDGRVEDVTGLLVTPGLIDLHGHWYEGSPYGLDPNRQPARLRVTTAVDAGSTGFSNFGAFRRHTIETATVRVHRVRPPCGRGPGHDRRR